MANKQINNQTFGTSIVDKEGKPTIEFFVLIEALINLEILDAEGSPEGVEVGRFKSLYIDTLTNFVYVKTTIESLKTGWVQI